MTADERERIAIVETKVDRLLTDVAGLKSDIAGLKTSIDKGSGATALLQRVVPWVALLVSAAVAVVRA